MRLHVYVECGHRQSRTRLRTFLPGLLPFLVWRKLPCTPRENRWCYAMLVTLGAPLQAGTIRHGQSAQNREKRFVGCVYRRMFTVSRFGGTVLLIG